MFVLTASSTTDDGAAFENKDFEKMPLVFFENVSILQHMYVLKH